MKILYENSLPLASAYFSDLGETKGFNSGQLQPEDLIDVDVLAVRSTTKVNPDLLCCANRLTLVATATAGINHLDTAYLEQQGINWMSAAGCNAQAVAEYVVSVLFNAHQRNHVSLDSATVGIVGAGHVGSALAVLLGGLNISYLLYDPPLAQKGDCREFSSWQDILNCDVITLHVPHIDTGKYPTANMIDTQALATLGVDQLLINACRGEVIDSLALSQRLKQADAPRVVLDVFANEPNIDASLLPLVWLATPHIAGHSIEGKLMGTQMVYEAICDLKGVVPDKTLEDFLPQRPNLHLDLELSGNQSDNLAPVMAVAQLIYDVVDDDRDFRVKFSGADSFAGLRKGYRVRREFAGHTIPFATINNSTTEKQLLALGFKIE